MKINNQLPLINIKQDFNKRIEINIENNKSNVEILRENIKNDIYKVDLNLTAQKVADSLI